MSVDQARNGGWCVYDMDAKEPVEYGTFSFPSRKFSFNEAIDGICGAVLEQAEKFGVDRVYIEDVMCRVNMNTFKKLAQLQGALIYALEHSGYSFDIVAPSAWQSFCKARGRTTKEAKARIEELPTDGKKASKVLSMQFVRDTFGIETKNDNLADAICIGYWAVNNAAAKE